jgi:hypothetical protein
MKGEEKGKWFRKSYLQKTKNERKINEPEEKNLKWMYQLQNKENMQISCESKVERKSRKKK